MTSRVTATTTCIEQTVPVGAIKLPLRTSEELEAASTVLQDLELHADAAEDILAWVKELSNASRANGPIYGQLRIAPAGSDIAAILLTITVVSAELANKYPQYFPDEDVSTEESTSDTVTLTDGSEVPIFKFIEIGTSGEPIIYDCRMAVVRELKGDMVARLNARTSTSSIGETLTAIFKEWVSSLKWNATEGPE